MLQWRRRLSDAPVSFVHGRYSSHSKPPIDSSRVEHLSLLPFLPPPLTSSLSPRSAAATRTFPRRRWPTSPKRLGRPPPTRPAPMSSPRHTEARARLLLPPLPLQRRRHSFFPDSGRLLLQSELPLCCYMTGGARCREQPIFHLCCCMTGGARCRELPVLLRKKKERAYMTFYPCNVD